MNNITKETLMSNNLSYVDNEMYLYKQPVALIQTSFFVELTENAIENNTEYNIYEIGRSSVKEFTRNMMNHNEMETKNMVKFLERLGSSAGWGDLALQELDEEPVRAVFRLRESIISTRIELEGKVDYLMSGMIAGALEEIYGKEFKCEEAECIADGDSACKFVCKETE